ncbi:MAG TPA: hypothetical protein VGM03_05260 [Phycisphaerae bacterium]
MHSFRLRVRALLAAVPLLSAAGSVRAELYSFYVIGNSPNAVNAAIGQSQLFFEVTAATVGGNSGVKFHFTNTGPAASSITDIYFDDGHLLNLASVTNGPSVLFYQQQTGNPVTPGNLPGGSTLNPPFVATQGFSADSNPPVQPNGVNPGEWVDIFFTLKNGATLADVIADLAADPNAWNSLRVGIHVQGFDNGGSESFVNNPAPVPVPAPAAAGLGALGLLLATWAKRRGRHQDAKARTM